MDFDALPDDWKEHLARVAMAENKMMFRPAEKSEYDRKTISCVEGHVTELLSNINKNFNSMALEKVGWYTTNTRPPSLTRLDPPGFDFKKEKHTFFDYYIVGDGVRTPFKMFGLMLLFILGNLKLPFL